MAANPLLMVHQEAGAQMADYDGWLGPERYASLEEEYQALIEGVALLDRSSIGRLRLTGEDALDLLNRLSTNELMDLEPESGIPTVLTSNKGRILDLLFVLRLPEHLLVLTAPQNRQKVADWIDFYTFVEDVALKDVTEDTAMLSLAGPGAGGLLDELTGSPLSALARYRSSHAEISGLEVEVVRTDFAGVPGYDLVVTAADGARLWEGLLSAGTVAGLRPVGMEALETVRVERGVPAYGKELSEEVNPLEANLLELISFTKGCYVGQEVVARLNTYKKVQKSLVGLLWESGPMPAPRSRLLLDGKQAGVVTSVARSPALHSIIGLGYVKKAQAKSGTLLTAESPDGPSATKVVELPFEVAEVGVG